MAQYDFGLDILRGMMRRAGELLPTSTDETGTDRLIDAKLYINKAYWELCALKPWRWARKRTQFVSLAEVKVTINTIDVEDGDFIMSVAQAVSMGGRKFFMVADAIPVRINHTAGSTILGTVGGNQYTGTATSGAGVIFQDEITVATDILAYPLITELHWGDEILVIPEGEALSEFPRNIYGAPRAQYATFLTDSVIRIMPWTSEARLFECAYNYRPNPLDFTGVGTGDTPILPRDSRVAILQRALEMLYADKRDGRITVAQNELRETLGRLGSVESTFGKPRIHLPRGFRVSG